jgi:hypothetical protein
MDVLNAQRVWLDEEFRAKINGQLMNNDAGVKSKREEKELVVKKLAPKFNHEVMESKCTPRINPLLGTRPTEGSVEFIKPFSELLRRFDFMCEVSGIDIPDDQREDLYIELCRQFYTNIENLNIKKGGSRKMEDPYNVYKMYVSGVLLHGDKYAVGEQKYIESSLKRLVGTNAWTNEKFIETEAKLAEKPYILPAISFEA